MATVNSCWVGFVDRISKQLCFLPRAVSKRFGDETRRAPGMRIAVDDDARN